MLPSLTSPAPIPIPARHTMQVSLLACGIIAPLVYAASDVIAGSRWPGYSFRDQAISELNALGSPTRSLTVAMGLVGYVLLLAFGVGVWRAACGNRHLRAVGGLLVPFSALALWAVPFASMSVRGAERSLSDTLHLVGGGISVSLLVAAIGFGAGAFGRGYRAFSIATILVLLGCGAWSGMDGARVAQNLATPWMGTLERISVYSYQLWLAVLAVKLLRRPRARKA